MRWVEAISAFVGAYPHLAYGLVCLLALSESLPLLGAVIPGTAVIVGLAALVPSGALKLYPMLGSAVAGAIIGDGFSFWLGHRFHREILDRWPFRRYPALIEKSEAFFHRHGGKSVFLARFTPGVRAFIPLVAGMVQMSVARFYAVNIMSAAIWAPAHILPGVFAGALAASMGPEGTRLVIVVLIAVLAAWFLVKLIRHAILRAVPVMIDLVDRLRDWAKGRDDVVSRLLLMLVSPTKNEPPVLALLIVVLIGAAWLFIGIAEDVITGDPLVAFDQAVFELLQGLRNRPVDALMIAITELGDTTVVVAVTVVVLGLLLLRRSWRTAGYFLSAVVGASLFNTAIKVAVHRERPNPDLYVGWSGFSFPSGHSTENAALYGFIAFLACRRLPVTGRISVVLPIMMLVLAIAVSRVYLGAHWFSDVSAGLAFAAVWLTILMISYLNHRANNERIDGILPATVLALAVGGSFNIWHHHTADVGRYAVKAELQTVSEAEWWNGEWQTLPTWRVDLKGEEEEPFVAQWAGELTDLEAQLKAEGWKAPDDWSLRGALNWFNAAPDMERLPAMPRLDRGKLPSLVLVKMLTGQNSARYVLSAWRSDVDIQNDRRKPLWLISVVEEKSYATPFGFNLVTTSNDFNFARDILDGDVLPAHRAERNLLPPSSGWDGRLVLYQG